MEHRSAALNMSDINKQEDNALIFEVPIRSTPAVKIRCLSILYTPYLAWIAFMLYCDIVGHPIWAECGYGYVLIFTTIFSPFWHSKRFFYCVDKYGIRYLDDKKKAILSPPFAVSILRWKPGMSAELLLPTSSDICTIQFYRTVFIKTVSAKLVIGSDSAEPMFEEIKRRLNKQNER